MASPAISRINLPNSRAALYNGPFCLLHGRLNSRAWRYHVPAYYSAKMPRMKLSREGPESFMMHMNDVAEKLIKIVPDSVKMFPWKEAKINAVQQLLIFTKKVVKWSLAALFIFSAVSDTIYSISRNRELVVPFGLLAGIMMTEFLKETSEELFRDYKEGAIACQLLVLGSFYFLVKILSARFSVGKEIFFLHTANGGLMQLLWHYKGLPEQEKL